MSCLLSAGTSPGPVRHQMQNLGEIQCYGATHLYNIILGHTILPKSDWCFALPGAHDPNPMRLATLPLPLLFAVVAYGSSGDRADDYQYCLSKGIETRCSKPPDFPLAMRLTRWTCEDNVKYSCMHSIVDEAFEKGEPVQQYYGKWPFWRLLGTQEPASVLFSALNFWAHSRER